MATTPKCPKCGADVLDFWVNKRGQAVGRCKPCGKMVNLGKPKEETGDETPASEEKGSSKPASKTPARAGGAGPSRKPKPGRRASAKPAAKPRPTGDGGKPVQQPKPKPGAATDDAFAAVKRFAKWLSS